MKYKIIQNSDYNWSVYYKKHWYNIKWKLLKFISKSNTNYQVEYDSFHSCEAAINTIFKIEKCFIIIKPLN